MPDLGPFTGLDLRAGAANAKGALIEAYNVIVNKAGALERRPALNFRVRLPADTVGLYAVGDQVRTAAKTGTSSSGIGPTVTFDYFNGNAAGATLLGNLTDSAGKTMILVKQTDGSTAVHHCGMPGVDSGYVAVSWAGTPEYAFIGMYSRGWTFDAAQTKLWYSALDNATPDKLNVWGVGGGEEIDTEGFENVGQHAAGAGRPRALGDFGGRLAVFYDAAVQIWRLDTDKTRYFREAVMTGIGTKHARSLVSVGPDLLLLTTAGVRSLTTITQTLDPREDDIGSRVDAIANEYANDTGANPVAIYARRLGCYIIAFGQNVLCLSLTPGQAIHGWSRWRLPVEVDAMCEAAGLVWIRSGRNVFALEPYDRDDADENSTPANVPVRWETVGRRYKTRQSAASLSITATEATRLQLVADNRPPALSPPGLPGDVSTTMPDLQGSPIVLPGRSPEPVTRTQGKIGRVLALRGQDDDTLMTWRLDAASIDNSDLGT